MVGVPPTPMSKTANPPKNNCAFFNSFKKLSHFSLVIKTSMDIKMILLTFKKGT